jgi:MFS family permease
VSSLIMLDSNIMAVSLPTIARSLGATLTDIQWVVSAYVLTYAALLLAAGNYADLRGRRRAMLGGLIVFAVSSAVCGVARRLPFERNCTKRDAQRASMESTAAGAVVHSSEHHSCVLGHRQER